MSFMEQYKRLDRLCKDMNGIGVTGYIQDMEKEWRGTSHVSHWKDDEKHLKHYRHIRNQIAHEVDCDEEDICSIEDEIWLEDFYQRILHREDPLARYHQETISSQSKQNHAKKSLLEPQHIPKETVSTYKQKPSKLKYILFNLCIILFFCIFLYMLLTK